MKFKNTISIIALLLFTSSAAPHDKRPTFTGATLYAYGQDISGLPVLFGDADAVVNSTMGGALYFVNEELSNVAAGSVEPNNTFPKNAKTISFSLYGGHVIYVDDNGNFLSPFWATITSNGFWQLT
ncbi:hypothetical protein BCIN_08g00040 [Botrytis cinerea B05.10]|uniref:Uncharacterized protein n=2 Tax=Botryotinia fuckeliana TaxID=40559 RepID=A0A384JNZ8_BOTFB|nr:hypothetical protein BCIN_08g00040 [Botrytis cinerea B05.10]ATZ52232.1 hypothetical protein BCIN_08g00040 [Botrytis cinerea B05.10]EMR85087.1 hypothetical protein BcDW1_6281 [Botrytis cinerea BcDW1]